VESLPQKKNRKTKKTVTHAHGLARTQRNITLNIKLQLCEGEKDSQRERKRG